MKVKILIILIVFMLLISACNVYDQLKLYALTMADGSIEIVCAYRVISGVNDNYYFLWKDGTAVAGFPINGTVFTAVPIDNCP